MPTENVIYIKKISIVVKDIEEYIKDWEDHDSWGDFEKFQHIYESLCELAGIKPKNLGELAYPDA